MTSGRTGRPSGRRTWAIDTGLPALAAATPERVATLDRSDIARVVALALAQTEASGDAIKGIQRHDRAEELAAARAALGRAEQDLADLRAGEGAYRGTEAGRAVSDLARAQVSLTRRELGSGAQPPVARAPGRRQRVSRPGGAAGQCRATLAGPRRP